MAKATTVGKIIAKKIQENLQTKKPHFYFLESPVPCIFGYEVEHGSFTPLVMTGLGGMGREASKCYSRLSESIAEKRKERYSGIKNWMCLNVCERPQISLPVERY